MAGRGGARTRACPASSFAFWIKYSCICSIKRNDRHTNSTQESSRFKATGQESADMQSEDTMENVPHFPQQQRDEILGIN